MDMQQRMKREQNEMLALHEQQRQQQFREWEHRRRTVLELTLEGMPAFELDEQQKAADLSAEQKAQQDALLAAQKDEEMQALETLQRIRQQHSGDSSQRSGPDAV